MGDMTDFSNYPAQRARGRRSTDRPRVNWSAVAVIVTLVLWLLGAASGLFGDYRRIGDRVTILETQRTNDNQRMERIENKLDRILERVK